MEGLMVMAGCCTSCSYSSTGHRWTEKNSNWTYSPEGPGEPDVRLQADVFIRNPINSEPQPPLSQDLSTLDWTEGRTGQRRDDRTLRVCYESDRVQ